MVLRYAPPWIRERRGTDAGPARFAPSPPTAPEMGDLELEPEPEPLAPRFEGDVAIEAVRHRLSLEPEAVPEPPIRMRRKRRLPPWIGRLAVMCVLAAGASFSVTWLTPPHIDARKLLPPRDIGAPFDSARHAAAWDNASPPPVMAKSARLAPAAMPAPLPTEEQRNDAIEPPVLAYAPPAGAAEPKSDQSPPVQHLEADEIAALLKRGQGLLKTGDIAAARLLLRRAANAGSAQAALDLGGTYDGAVLAELGVVGFASENAEALFWYRKAAEGGASEAESRLGRLRSKGE